MVVRHGLGEVWSRFVSAWLNEAMASVGIVPKVEVTDASVVVRFARP